jgi:hypothetical protein
MIRRDWGPMLAPRWRRRRRRAAGHGVARPLDATALGGRWGIEHRPTERWVAYGSEAQCRTLAAHLNEADAILARSAATATGAGGTAP